MQRYSCRPAVSGNVDALSCGKESNLENIEKENICQNGNHRGCQKDKPLHMLVLQSVKKCSWCSLYGQLIVREDALINILYSIKKE